MFRFLIFLIFVFHIQPVVSQNAVEAFKTYENEEFTFNYPESWCFKTIPSIKNETNKVIVSLFKNEISDKKINESSILHFFVYEMVFNYKDLDEFITKLKNSSHMVDNTKINVKSSYTKIDKNHYSSIRRTSISEKGKSTKMVTTNSFVHYYLNNNKLYSLDLMYSPELANSIIDDAVLIFESFQFKN